MPNPLFQQLSQNNGGISNPLQMIQKFNELRQNPQQFLQYLLDSRRIPPQMQNVVRQNINDPFNKHLNSVQLSANFSAKLPNTFFKHT